MENPLSGVMEWYQGLPQAAQIGIPVVGAGAVYLIAKGGKGGGIGGQVVAGPFGASSGGGTGGTGGNTPPPTPTPKPKPKPVPHPKPIPVTRPPHPKPGPGNHKPKPPGHGSNAHPSKPPVRPTHERPGVKANPQPWQWSQHPHPHLPSSHIQSHPLGIASQRGIRNATKSDANDRWNAAGRTATLANQRGMRNAERSLALDQPKDIHPVQGVARHPMQSHNLHNRVPAAKAHQHRNDQNRLAANTLTRNRGIHKAAL